MAAINNGFDAMKASCGEGAGGVEVGRVVVGMVIRVVELYCNAIS